MNFILAAFTTLLIAVFAAAFAAPYVVDWNAYRTVFEAQATKLVGRPVRVEGDVDLTILPVPEVRFKRVRIESLDGDAERPFARARAFKMVLSLAPLLRGQLEARQVELDRPVINLRYGEDGRGNWEGLVRDDAALPFMPEQVRLKSVNIDRGIITLMRPDGRPVWQLEELTGELSAESLSGPFRFQGTTLVGESPQELRVNIGRRGGDDSFPLRATLRADGTIYQADGILRSAGDSPVFDGMFTATTPAEPSQGDAPLPLLDVKANGRVGLEAAEFSAIEIAISRQQRQQTMTGTATARWDMEPVLEAALGARWLDLDLLIGTPQDPSDPAQILASLPDVLARLPIPAARARISADFQQVSLGGDLIRDLRASARLNRGGWAVEHIEAGLPGESEVRFSGNFSRDTGDVVLTGDFSASSRNLSRLLHWAMPADFAAETGPARALSLSGDVSAAQDHFRIDQLSARIGDSRMTGRLDMRRGDQPQVNLSLAAAKLDLRNLIAPGQGSSIIAAMLDGSDSTQSPKATDHEAAHAASALATFIRDRIGNDPLSLDLRVGHLWLPEIRLADVSADISRSGNRLDVRQLALRGPGELQLRASGHYDGSDPLAAGHLLFSLGAARAEPLAQVLALWPDYQPPSVESLQALMPLRLAGVLGRDDSGRATSALRVDGVAAGTELSVSALLPPAAGNGLELSLVARNSDSRRMLQQVFPGLGGWLGPAVGSAEDQQPGLLTLDLEPTQSLAASQPQGANVRFTAGDMTAEYRGQLDFSWPIAPRHGRFSLSSGSLLAALRVAGLDLPEGSTDGAFSLSGELSTDAARYALNELQIVSEANRLGGSLALDVSGPSPALDVALSGDRISVPLLAIGLLERETAAISQAEAITRDTGGTWSDRRFSPGALDSMRASITLDAARLHLSEALELDDARLAASLADGVLNLRALTGELGGGTLSASGKLERERGRMILRGQIDMNRLDLAQLTQRPDGQPLASAQAGISLKLAGEGVSPSGLITSLSGEGRLSLGAGRIRNLDTRMLAQTAQDYFEAAEPQEGSIAADLAEALRQAEFQHRRARAGLVLEGGIVRTRRLVLRPPRGRDRVAISALVDLASLSARWQWDLRAVAQGNLRLPAVRVSFEGPLAELGTIEPQLSAEEYEQFLIVRRLERDVERLERLRAPQSPPAQPATTAQPEPRQPETQQPESGFATRIETVPARPASPAPETPPQAAPQAAPIELDPDLVRDLPPTSRAGPADAPGASASAPAESRPDAPPSRSLDDPRVVEDARREILREQRRQPSTRPNPDPFSSIFNR